MDIRKQLAQFKAQFDPILAAYLDARIADARVHDSFTAEGLAHCKKIILSGGKRLRPALTVWSYEGLGGTNRDAIMHAAMSVELIHAFLLVHDDIMDRDAQRHGVQTLHAHYTKELSMLLTHDESVHAGNSLAIIFGDLLNAFGNHALFDAHFEKERIFCALKHLQDVISRTGIGQIKDVMFEYGVPASRDDIITMYENKTAHYTIESPLVLGAILADAPENIHKTIHAFARPLGIAFQIRDDIIGLFGDAETIGKPVGSDIAEGKMTLLVVLAQKLTTPAQRKRLNDILGTHDLSADDIATFRSIITESGALAEAHRYAEIFVTESRTALQNLPYDHTTKMLLDALATYLTKRNF